MSLNQKPTYQQANQVHRVLKWLHLHYCICVQNMCIVQNSDFWAFGAYFDGSHVTKKGESTIKLELNQIIFSIYVSWNPFLKRVFKSYILLDIHYCKFFFKKIFFSFSMCALKILSIIKKKKKSNHPFYIRELESISELNIKHE